jgi:hypothetical protein
MFERFDGIDGDLVPIFSIAGGETVDGRRVYTAVDRKRGADAGTG